VVEVVAKTYVVTDAQKLIQHWHGEDELSRQRTKGLTDWSNSAEFDLMRSTLVSGVSGTVPKMSKSLTLSLEQLIMKVSNNLLSLYGNSMRPMSLHI
jgi:lambda repressor-like predicted transcriptional regulator